MPTVVPDPQTALPNVPEPARAISPAAVNPVTAATVRAAVGASPILLTNVATSAASDGVIPVVAMGLNVIIEWIKNVRWFPEKTLTVPFLALLAFGASFAIWHFASGDTFHAIVNGFGILGQSHINYHGARAADVPIFQPTKNENRWSGGGQG